MVYTFPNVRESHTSQKKIVQKNHKHFPVQKSLIHIRNTSVRMRQKRISISFSLPLFLLKCSRKFLEKWVSDSSENPFLHYVNIRLQAIVIYVTRDKRLSHFSCDVLCFVCTSKSTYISFPFPLEAYKKVQSIQSMLLQFICYL